jgi:DNA-binding response OmpR family regulator/signal transduction histidine kinase
MNYTSTILIVDDEPAGRDTLESLLVAYDYTLAFAGDGKEAIHQAQTLLPDLILLDVMMPDMDGFEVCRQLRENPLTSEVPIIMVTALDDQDSRLQGLEVGADDFISKPFNRTELRARIRTITRLNRYRHLMEERSRFEWVVDHAEAGFIIVNPDGTLRYANETARRYLYLVSSGEEPTVKGDFHTLVRPHYQYEPADAWTDWNNGAVPTYAMHEVQPVRYLVRPETSTTETLWLQVDIIDLPAGSQTGSLVRLHDVTNQMTRQRQVWTFHSLISHKLSTPLTGLINSLYLLNDEARNLDPEEVKEFAAIAMQSAQRLRKQIADIRSYVRAPSLVQPGEACNPACIKKIVARIAGDLGLDQVRVTGCHCLEEKRMLLSTQAVELILHQLLENAKKFHPQHTPYIEVVLSADTEQMLQVCIRDDGITLAPEQITRVWIPYFQAEKGFSGEVVGMGLGLSMIAVLLWNIGGKYRIANRKPGPGVEVALLIPMQPMGDTEEKIR